MILPKNIQSLIADQPYETNNIGMSDSKILSFDDMVLKIEKQSDESDNEHRMMKWLDGKIYVPKVLCFEQMNDTNYLLMSKLKGQMLCSEEFCENPAILISLLAKGLKMLWDIKVSDCLYNNSIDNKLQLAEIRVANNQCSIEDAEPDTYGENGFQSPSDLLAWLKENKPIENPVFSHGDFCLPNIFAENNEISGFIDLGRSGIADKYQDIALCYRSLKHNLYGKYKSKENIWYDVDLLFDELGIVPDWDRINYYILLDELF